MFERMTLLSRVSRAGHGNTTSVVQLCILVCTVSRCQAEVYGDDCTVDSNCSYTGGACSGDSLKCTCDTTRYYTGSACELFVILGETCQTASTGDTSLPCSAANAECLSSGGGKTCQCKSTHYKSGTDVCSEIVILGETCQTASSGDASVPCSATNAQCLSGGGGKTCQCKSTHYKSGTDVCSEIVILDETCQTASSGDASVPCSATNAQCLSSGGGKTCQCKSTHYKSGTDVCSEIVILDGTCQTASSGDASVPCSATNAQCLSSGGGKTCQCTSAYYKSGTDVCSEIVILDETCQTASSGDASVPCSATNAQCLSSGGGKTCQCTSAYYKSGTDVCSEIVILDGTCQTASSGDASVPCSATNAQCLSSGGGKTCQCTSAYYKSGTDVCSEIVILDETCQTASSGDASVPCSATNAQCLSSGGGKTCQCTSAYYKSGTDVCSEIVILGETCQTASSGDASLPCSATNAQCLSGGGGKTCQCTSAYYKSGTDVCSEIVILGETCQTASSGDASLPCSATNAQCLSSGGGKTCQCTSAYYKSGTDVCSEIVILGETCQTASSGDASLPCLATNAQCLSSGGGKTCQCTSAYYKSGTDVCSAIVILDETCQTASSGDASVPCSATNAQCLSGGGGKTCQCTSAYYKSGTDVCSEIVILGETCQTASSGDASLPCLATNAQCLSSGGGKTCQCTSAYYKSGTDVCSAIVILDETCQTASSGDASVPCSATNAQCLSGGGGKTCQCTSAYYKSGTDVCSEIVILGETCQTASSGDASVPCSATNAQCLSSGGGKTCQCKSTHYQSGTNTCSEKNVVSLGQTCQQASSGVQSLPCLANNAKCLLHTSSGYTCQCITKYYQSGANTCTLSNVVTLGQTCQQPSFSGDTNLACSATDAECLWSTSGNTCQCKSTHYQSGPDTCSLIVTLGQSCQLAFSGDQRVPCSATNAQCLSNGNSGYTCQCESTYYNSGLNTCSEKKDLGVTCTSAAECRANNVVCTSSTGNTCSCDSGYYQSDSITCSPQSNIDGPCSNTQECNANNVECTDGTCSCAIGYYKSSSNTCSQQGFLGVTCTSAVECSANNVTCTGSCSCASGYYQSGSNTCSLIVTLGHACLEASLGDQSLPCSATNAQCLSSGNSGNTTSCQCKSTHYQSETNTCSQIQALGGSCIVYAGSVSAPCSASSAECTKTGDTYTCLCSSIYYQAGNNMCSLVSELRVTSITFSAIDTTSMVVSWVPPTNKITFIDKYIVVWKPYGSNIVGSTLEITGKPLATTATLSTNITPGDGYKISITSVNTQTQAGSDRSALKEARQSAKPLPPSSENENSSNLDASDGNIYLVWNRPSAGEVNGYRLNLPQLGLMNQSVMSASYMYTNPDLLNGQRYNLTIESRSEDFGSGYVWSDPFTWEFKTVVQVPGPPRNVMCVDDDITDESIFLTWSAPEFPNGDIVQYHIFVSGDPTFNVNTEIDTRQFKIENLNPGRDYSFKIQTQNELYNSISMSNQAYCTTRARMSEAPRMLMKTDVTSRDITVSWKRPDNTHSAQNWGYVLQVRKSSETDCVLEKLFKCSGCQTFQESTLSKMCPTVREQTTNETLTELDKDKSYKIIGLDPDTNYSIIVTAVNSAGRGHEAEVFVLTNEEAPQQPKDVEVKDVEQTNFSISWNLDSPRPGKVTYTVTVEAVSPAPSHTFNTEGFENRNVVAVGLEEYWEYQVTVMAATSEGTNTSLKTVKYRTLPAPPGPVSEFNVVTATLGGNYRELRVSWKAPLLLQRNSFIKLYTLKHNTSTDAPNADTSLTFQSDSSQEQYSQTFAVIPEKYYSFEVYAVNNETSNSDGEMLTEFKQAPAGVPKNEIDESETAVVKAGAPKQTEISLSIYEDFLNQDSYGEIKETGLIGCASGNCNFNNYSNMPLSKFRGMDNWQTAKGKGFTTYRITKASWVTDMNRQGSRKRRAPGDLIRYTVGVESCSNDQDFCNGALKEDTEYIIVVVACTDGGCLLSDEYGPFKTEAAPTTSTPIGMIVGVVVGVVVVVAIVIVVIFFIRRRRAKPADMQKMHNIETGDEEEDVKDIKRKRPVLLNNFESYLRNMHKDSNLLFSAEYEDLKTLSPKHPTVASDLEENRAKNRYINIIPFDHTRVKLSTNGEDDKEDYINGNYLPGYSSPREYIGCQGPLPGTIDDFWRMTWEQNVHVIVMLTLCKEGQKIKCEQYWPDEVGDPKQYGDVVVEVTSYSSIKTYDYRMFKLTNGSVSRVVKHFHFLTWQDFQANVKHDIILNFIKSVRNHIQPPDSAGPSIIHCSAGVGRTGTYIALDHLMQFINDHDFNVPIDIFNMVLKMRDNRSFMVQTEQQYIFIHDCVKEMLEEKRKLENEANNIYENQAMAADENIYANEQETSLYENWSNSAVQKTEL